MDIYLFERHDGKASPEELLRCVVIAESEAQARELVIASFLHYERFEIDYWRSPKPIVRSIGVAHPGAKPCIVCRDFYEG